MVETMPIRYGLDANLIEAIYRFTLFGELPLPRAYRHHKDPRAVREDVLGSVSMPEPTHDHQMFLRRQVWHRRIKSVEKYKF